MDIVLTHSSTLMKWRFYGGGLASGDSRGTCPDECYSCISWIEVGLQICKGRQLYCVWILCNGWGRGEASRILGAGRRACTCVRLPQPVLREAWVAAFSPSTNVGRGIYVRIQLVSRGWRIELWRCSASLEPKFQRWGRINLHFEEDQRD